MRINKSKSLALMSTIGLVFGLSGPTAAWHLDVGEIEHVYEIPNIILPLPDIPPQYLTTAEGIATDRKGNVFITTRTLTPTGRTSAIIKISRFGGVTELTTHLPFANGFEPSAALGLATDKKGNVYVAINTGDPSTTGVYFVSKDGSKVGRLPDSGAMVFANALTFDKKGRLYVTDSVTGSIWRFSKHCRCGEMWVQHPLLEPSDAPPGPGGPLPGANGIVFVPPNHLYVANTANNWIADVQIKRGGSPDVQPAPVGFVPFPDGLDADPHGNVYVTVAAVGLIPNFPIAVAKIDPRNGALTPIAFFDPTDPTDPMNFNIPTSLAFGQHGHAKKNLYVVNSGLLGVIFGPLTRAPGVLKIGVGPHGSKKH